MFGSFVAFILAAQVALALPFNSTTTRPVTTTPELSEAQILRGFSKVADTPGEFSAKAVLAVSAMSGAQASAYKPYTHLAAAAYCSTSSVKTWSCGQHCSALPGMVVYAAGGNNADTPDWYVGYLPSLGSAVVSHQGTTPSNLESDYIDVDFFMTTLSSTYFPGISSSVEVHNGFAAAQGRTAATVLSSVRKIFSDHGISKVVVIGHSLGGAIAILDAMSLKTSIPSATVKVVTYGQPRVGNQAFADWVDSHLSDNSRITHAEDIVPIVPGRFLGFHHSAGEKHIDPSGNWWACSGQDNEADPQCSTGEVGNIFEGNTSDHSGPYDDGITMGC